MPDLTSVLIWVFGLLAALTMLGSIVHRRREFLVGLLRAHVDKEVGPFLNPDKKQEDESNQNPL